MPGTLAGITGAALIGIVAALVSPSSTVDRVDWVLVCTLAGTSGMFVDSLLGATLEARSELIDNDQVNLVCTLVGAGVAMALQSLLR